MKTPVPARPVKHSLTLSGHRTSVSLEDAFWQAFRAMADRDGLTINALAAQIDADRGDIGLASAIRVHVLRDAQRRD
ncbi:MAG: putative DNA-binding ribbon-helix-helix protein [Loktanella salsilacus]|jgi:predicted DNA-binding ribbon-helix-helix protein